MHINWEGRLEPVLSTLQGEKHTFHAFFSKRLPLLTIAKYLNPPKHFSATKWQQFLHHRPCTHSVEEAGYREPDRRLPPRQASRRGHLCHRLSSANHRWHGSNDRTGRRNAVRSPGCTTFMYNLQLYTLL